MNDTDRLKLVRHLIDSDVAYDADCLSLDVMQGRPVTEREKSFAELITRIYTAVHPGSGCLNPHEAWEKENVEDLKHAEP